MILRLTTFFALISVFYFYCKKDPVAGKIKQPADLNKIEMQNQIYPVQGNITRVSNLDTLYYRPSTFISEHD